MFSFQARAARAILKLGVRDVAQAIGVTPNTVSRFESGAADDKDWRPHRLTERALQEFYEAQGLEFPPHGVRVEVHDVTSELLSLQVQKEAQD
jgi:transcriptional regulator with XRE-family HTH domain